MIEAAQARLLLTASDEELTGLVELIAFVGLENPVDGLLGLRSIAESPQQLKSLGEILPSLLYSLSETADPDRSLRNFQRFLNAIDNREQMIQAFVENPRSIEILTRLFVGSQFLTEILLRHPEYLDRLTQYKRLAEFKSREDFLKDADASLTSTDSLDDLKIHLRTFQQWEILRIAACDTFGLMDLKTVTLQLSSLADAIVQIALKEVLRIQQLNAPDFTVIAFGKLGGLELNYSSDIDLVFLCKEQPDRLASIGQKLIQVLSDFTPKGFLYRVDMRLRPWGNSGPLVTTADAYSAYYEKNAELWERQAILKARTIAGNIQLGYEVLDRVKKEAFNADPEVVRESVRAMKDQIEEKVSSQFRTRHGVKGGPGGIRDIEFLVQYLQFIHGNETPQIRRVGTLASLIYLSEANLLHAQEYRTLSSAYVMLRTVEHSLQLMHNQPEYFLPESIRELNYLARRLDFPNSELFLEKYANQTRAVKEIFDKHMRQQSEPQASVPQIATTPSINLLHEPKSFDASALQKQLSDSNVVAMEIRSTGEDEHELYLVGYDHLGEVPIFCGLLLVYGFDIISGTAETIRSASSERPVFVNRFRVRATSGQSLQENDVWSRFKTELNALLKYSLAGNVLAAQKQLVQRLAETIPSQPDLSEPLLPVEISIEQDEESNSTILNIQGEDVPGFLFELTNAISVNGYSINRMTVESDGIHAIDTLWIEEPNGNTVLDEVQRNHLRTTIVLIKHFTHFLPHAPNSEKALLHFRELLKNLFEQEDWIDQMQRLQQPDVLKAIAKLLGFSDFLWEDFLRLQHHNLFPVVTDLSGLQHPRTREELSEELSEKMSEVAPAQKREVLNEFKDRAMMRVDMRHILELQSEFGMFSRELTAVTETVVEAAVELCLSELHLKYGRPKNDRGEESLFSLCALGKCGGSELGYASDIELMFLYDHEGHTTGPQRISNAEFFQRLVEQFQKTIYSREKRIFEVDLRLRPYGNAGSLAVSQKVFENYFRLDGPAWPYERQALVKLRPIAGDQLYGNDIVDLRDRLIYTGKPFDLSAMRAIREKQIRQLVKPGTFHAKLSPGGLVDCEYLVQGLQMTFGHLSKEIREPNTRLAMKGLEQQGILTSDQRVKLRDAYRFLRRLIDGMRMVRGDASDLTIPHHETEQFEFLAKRLGFKQVDLHAEIEQQTRTVIDFISQFEQLIGSVNRLS